jgi:hypothetical protein
MAEPFGTSRPRKPKSYRAGGRPGGGADEHRHLPGPHRGAIEHEILPKMIVAGFSTVTITSVVVTSIIAGRIGGG